MRQRRTTRGSVGVGGSVEEENVLGLKLKLTLAFHAHTQTHTVFAFNIAGPRTCAPKAYHEGQCGCEMECED